MWPSSTVFAILVLINCICCDYALSRLAHGLSYRKLRASIIDAEDSLTTGSDIVLNFKELLVNDILCRAKQKELREGFYQQKPNAASMHFFDAKPLIERSRVYAFLRQMPKGALLHVHNSASISAEGLVKTITYMPGLLRCRTSEGLNIFTFRRSPQSHRCDTNYVSVSDERRRFSSPEAYDRALETLFDLGKSKPKSYDTLAGGNIWQIFENMFDSIEDVLTYLPAFRLYHRRLLEELYEDNIMYAELRISFKELYDSEGRVYPSEQSINELLHIIHKFCLEHPRFLGIKAIISNNRNGNLESMKKKLDNFKHLHFKYPKFIIGFDLVGQEDKGTPLYNLEEILEDLPKSANYFFHAGETNWYGSPIDLNLLDAILLNSKRIGHGYALMKHPILLDAVKNRSIAIEVNPISNQVLGLVRDLRNHPGAQFISQNIPMVISNDDPGFWGAKGLSYDFYYAFMSIAPINADLKILKKFIWNSIDYSMLNNAEKEVAFFTLQQLWDNFLNKVIEGDVI